MDKPADDQVTKANFAVEVQYPNGNMENINLPEFEAELTICQKIGFVKKESWQGVISQVLALDPFHEQSQSGTRKYCKLQMQVVRQDPPDKSDWEELYIYGHGDDCLLCNWPTYINDFKTDEVNVFNIFCFVYRQNFDIFLVDTETSRSFDRHARWT